MNIIVVSNSPKCLDHECGHIIDRFDIVVRINNFVILNYEKYIGSKTTVWVHNNNKKDIFKRNIDNISSVLIMSLNEPYPDDDISPKIKHLKTECEQLYKELKEITPGYICHSLGGFILLYFLKRYKNVFSYGFDAFASYGHYWDKNHEDWEGHRNKYEPYVIDYLREKYGLIYLEDYLNKNQDGNLSSDVIDNFRLLYFAQNALTASIVG